MNLYQLTFFGNGAKYLSELIETNLPNLKELNLSISKFDKNGAKLFFESLKKNTNLQKLYFVRVKIDREEQKILSEMLIENKTLKEISLCEFSENCIYEALKKNNSLESISFKYLENCDKNQIFEILKKNKNLKKLNLTSNGMDDQKMIQLFSILESNNTLKSITIPSKLKHSIKFVNR